MWLPHPLPAGPRQGLGQGSHSEAAVASTTASSTPRERRVPSQRRWQCQAVPAGRGGGASSSLLAAVLTPPLWGSGGSAPPCLLIYPGRGGAVNAPPLPRAAPRAPLSGPAWRPPWRPPWRRRRRRAACGGTVGQRASPRRAAIGRWAGPAGQSAAAAAAAAARGEGVAGRGGSTGVDGVAGVRVRPGLSLREGLARSARFLPQRR